MIVAVYSRITYTKPHHGGVPYSQWPGVAVGTVTFPIS